MTQAATKVSYVLDPAHSHAEFAVRHMMFATVKGHFSHLEGDIELNPPDLSTAVITGRIATASVETRDATRDGHLRSADFFDAENHPFITFASRTIAAVGSDRYEITGDLTIRGITRGVKLDARLDGVGRDPWGQERLAFSGSTSINRKDFGLTWNVALEAGGFLVGDEVRLNIQVQAIRKG